MTNESTLLTTWDDIASFFPGDWRETARSLNVMKGARQDKDLDSTMHTLLLHLVCGYSLKETVTRARICEPKLYTASHVSLRERLIKFAPLFKALSAEMFDGRTPPGAPGVRLRLFDATEVVENGPTGSRWRFHYSFTLPDMACDFARLTATKGEGTGETLARFPVAPGDHILADRGYSAPSGIAYADALGAKVCVRFNSSTPIRGAGGGPLRLLSKLKALGLAGMSAEWPCEIPDRSSGRSVGGRLCAIRKDDGAIEASRRKLAREGAKHGYATRAETFEYNKYVLVFTTFDEGDYPLGTVLAVYRWRWQVELVFKRFKSLLQFGHLPTSDEEASGAWLYGKLFAALLVERISRLFAGSFSPWRGGPDVGGQVCEPLEAVRVGDALSPAMAGAGAAPLEAEGQRTGN